MAYVTKVYVPDDLAEYTTQVVATGGTGPQGATGPAGSGIELLTTKGDLLGYSTEGVRIPAGSNGQVLVARSSATPGVAWETPDVTQTELDAVAAAAQPLDSDLTAIAALTTTAYGRALLELANAAALQTAGGLVIGTNVQAYSAVLAATTASFTSADETKLDGIEAGATADQSAAEILAALLTVDGAGSGLDADLLDGSSSAAFLKLVAAGASVEDAGAIESNVNTVASSGATETLDTSVYAVHDVTMSEACTLTFSNPAPSGKCTVFVLILRGAFTPTFPAAVDWGDATPPTYTTPSVYTFTTVTAGTPWMGAQIGKAFA